MKLSIAIGDTNALDTAFVVFRGFDSCIPKAAQLGFNGVELALRRAGEINPGKLSRMLNDTGLEVSCISTGQVYADGGYMLTTEDAGLRKEVMKIFREFIDLAAEFGGLVNIGRVRGQVGDRDRQKVEKIFIEAARELCAYGAPKNVSLILEPVNRYEIDFINNLDQGVELMKKVGMPNMMLMPDLFHMNIEDRDIGRGLVKNIGFIKYIHVADSNRLAPGQGHLNFQSIFNDLFLAGYDGWISAEILPRPDPDTAALQAASFLLPLIRAHNARKDGQLNEQKQQATSSKPPTT